MLLMLITLNESHLLYTLAFLVTNKLSSFFSCHCPLQDTAAAAGRLSSVIGLARRFIFSSFIHRAVTVCVSSVSQAVVRGSTAETKQEAEWTVIAAAPLQEEHSSRQEVQERCGLICFLCMHLCMCLKKWQYVNSSFTLDLTD